MKKKLLLLLYLIFLSTIISGCGKNINYYDFKETNGLIDKTVEIVQKINKDNGVIKISFIKKQIPFKTKLFVPASAYGGTIKVRGELQKGSMKIKLITEDNIIVRNIFCNSGTIDIETKRFDLYGGLHKLIIEFYNAENGKISLNYHVFI